MKLLLLILVCCVSPAHSELVILKDGNIMLGDVESTVGDVVRLKSNGIIVEINKEHIKSINYEVTGKFKNGSYVVDSTSTLLNAVSGTDRPTALPPPDVVKFVARADGGLKGAASPALPEESILELSGGYRADNKELEGGLWGEVARMWNMDRLGSLGLAIGYSKSDNKVRSLSKGDMAIWSFLGRVRFHPSPEKPVGVFADVSGGLYGFVHRLDSDFTSALAANGYSVSEDVRPAFGASVGGGVRFGPPNFNFALGVTRHFMRPEATTKATNHNTSTTQTSKQHIDLNSTIIQAAFRFQY